MKDSADAILRKLARDALVNRPADPAAEDSGSENLAGKMARRLLQLNFKASTKSRRSRDGRPTASSE